MTRQVLAQSSFPSGIFAGTAIPKEALVQTLTLEEPTTVSPPVQKEKGNTSFKSSGFWLFLCVILSLSPYSRDIDE